MSEVQSICPGCGEPVDDHDGFGVMRHEACGYCAHPSSTGVEGADTFACDICGAREPMTRSDFPVTDDQIDRFDAEHGPFPPTDEATVKRLADRVIARLDGDA